MIELSIKLNKCLPFYFEDIKMFDLFFLIRQKWKKSSFNRSITEINFWVLISTHSWTVMAFDTALIHTQLIYPSARFVICDSGKFGCRLLKSARFSSNIPGRYYGCQSYDISPNFHRSIWYFWRELTAPENTK
jgi:hypothetical protein